MKQRYQDWIDQLSDEEKKHPGERLNQVLFDIRQTLTPMLEHLQISDYTKAWVLHAASGDLLQYTIEDDHLDIRDQDYGNVIHSLKQFLDSEKLDMELFAAFLERSKDMISAKELAPTFVRVSGGRVEIRSRYSPYDQPEHAVSSARCRLMPILEDNVVDPRDFRVADAFAERIEVLKKELGITALCFVQKGFGPVGALAMVSELVRSSGLPAAICRPGYTPKRARMVGRKPTPEDRIAIVYDLIATGGAIKQVAQLLTEEFSCEVSAAVVMMTYTDDETIELKSGNTVRVERIGGTYSENMKKRKVISKDEYWTPTPLEPTRSSLKTGGGAMSVPPKQGGTPMERPLFKEPPNAEELSRIEESKEIVPVVLEAFLELAREQSQAIALFHEAYQERSRIPGLFESKKDGLWGMLSCLLGNGANEEGKSVV